MHNFESLLTKALWNVEKTDTSNVSHLEDYHNLEHLEHVVAKLKVKLALHFSVFELKPDRMDFLRFDPCFIALLEICHTHLTSNFNLKSDNLKKF